MNKWDSQALVAPHPPDSYAIKFETEDIKVALATISLRKILCLKVARILVASKYVIFKQTPLTPVS